MRIFTVMVMLFLCGISGIFATIYHNRYEKLQSKIENIFCVLWYGFGAFFILNMYRCAMWKYDEVVFYSEDKLMLVMDLLLSGLAVIVCPHFYQRVVPMCVKKQKASLGRLTFALVAVASIVTLGRTYLESSNIRVAINEILLPQFWFCVAGACLLVAYILSYGIGMRKNSVAKEPADTMKKKKRISRAQGVILLYLVTAWVYPFVETLMMNYSEWYFSIADIVLYCAIFLFLVYGAILLLFTVLEKKAWSTCYVCLFGFSVAAYVQTMFLNGSLIMMDGSRPTWQLGLKLGNLAIWIGIIVIAFVGKKALKGNWRKVYHYISCALVCMQMVALVSLLPQFMSEEQNSKVLMEEYLSTDGMFEVASDENVFFFVLDCYDVENMDEVLSQDGSFLDRLEGFTYYPDMVSQFSRTLPSVAYLLTQEVWYRDIPYDTYLQNAYRNCEFWEDIQEEGYALQFFDADNILDANTKKKAENYVEQGHSIEEKISFVGCIRSMMNVGHYRVLPYLWKDYQYYTAETVNEYVVETSIWDHPIYVMDDAKIYADYKESGLQIRDKDKLFKYMHLTGAHNPYTLDENAQRVKESQNTAVNHFKGCMQIVFDFIAELQELGLYEDAMIIITADHGENFMFEELQENTNPILFIKPSGVASGDLAVSDVYASQHDILYTIAQDLNLDSALEGINLLDETQADAERVRYHYYDVVVGTRQMGIAPYEIKGSALDFANWTKTGEYKEFIY